jgi:predicted acylesterase/phospholipase RssA
MTPKGLARAACAVALALLALAGCATLPREPFTQSEQALAAPEGFDDVRYTEDQPRLLALLALALKPDARGEVDVLALSGGGANGAYAAGLLHGWTLAGGRPNFRVVTGVSTGALTAPLAFAGPAWDDSLSKAYLGPTVTHLLRGRGAMGLITPGLYRRRPLRDLVYGYVTDNLLRAVAAEHAKGRRLLVATTNLDTEKLMVWDMGAIATHGGPAARNLFAEVLIASASVPGIFPPTLIPVTWAGRTFLEMHVDGQTESPFFAFPPALLLSAAGPDHAFRTHLHIIVNGQIDATFSVTPGSTMPILTRSFGTASKASVRAVLISTAQFCQTHGCDIALSTLPVGQKDDPLDFSAAHERALFAAGEAAAKAGTAWRGITPPQP